MDALEELSHHPVFLGHAKAETMLRDFNRLRSAIRCHDSAAAEDAWENCERWVDQLKPLTEPDVRRLGTKGTALIAAYDEWKSRALFAEAQIAHIQEIMPAKPGVLRRALLAAKARRAEVKIEGNGPCSKCGAPMQPGKAIGQTFTGGMPDFPGDERTTTLSAGGPGEMIDCLKCPECGWSVRKTLNAVDAAWPTPFREVK